MRRPLPNFSLYPLSWLAASFAAGIMLGKTTNLSSIFSLVIAIACGLLSVVLLKKKFTEAFLLAAFCFAGAFVFSASVGNVRSDRIKSLIDSGVVPSGEPVEIEGTLTGKPEPVTDGAFLTLRVDKITHNGEEQTASGNVKLFAGMGNEQAVEDYASMGLEYGTRLRAACLLEREERYQNPGVIPATLLLDQQGIDATAVIKSPRLVEVLGRDSVFLPLAWIYDQRQQMISELHNDLDQSTAAVLSAALLGDRHFLDKHTADIFRIGGTFHILIISGLHITFIGGLILFLLRSFTRSRVWPFFIAAPIVWGYALAVGAEVPVVRAAIMFTVLAFSTVVHRKGSLLNSLGFCALVVLVWRPEDLFTASFQLTFVAVAAIVVIAFPVLENLRAIGAWTPSRTMPFPPSVHPWLTQFCEALYWREEVWDLDAKRQIWTTRLFKSEKPWWISLERVRRIVARLFEAVLVSTVAQICLLPFSVVYFHRVTIASVLMNLWAGLFLALESFAASLGIFLARVSGAFGFPFLRMAELFNWFLVDVPGYFVGQNSAGFRLPAYSGPSKVVYFLYFVPVVVIAYLAFTWRPFDIMPRRSRFLLPAVVSVATLAAVIVLHPFSAPGVDGKLHVDFLDVGQGDSALITFPNGETMLVDGGGTMSFRNDQADDGEVFEPDTQRIGEAVVSQFLWNKGYSSIDYIVASHADADHIQGLSDVAKNFHINYALFGRMPPDNADLVELVNILDDHGVLIDTIARGDEWNIGGVKIEVLYPDQGDVQGRSDNDHSVVLRLTYGGRRILMTGDIEKGAESDLLTHLPLIKADVVKVPHHGSKTSSTDAFVNASDPTLAVISVGRHSIFGHPSAEVVDRWRGRKAEVLTTGRQGTISIATDGSVLEIKSFLEQ